MKSKEDGFSLIEMVFILMIISILLLFPVLSVQRTIENTQIDLFFGTLLQKLHKYKAMQYFTIKQRMYNFIHKITRFVFE